MDPETNVEVSRAAHAGDVGPLAEMFAAITVERDPAYRPAVGAPGMEEAIEALRIGRTGLPPAREAVASAPEAERARAARVAGYRDRAERPERAQGGGAQR